MLRVRGWWWEIFTLCEGDEMVNINESSEHLDRSITGVTRRFGWDKFGLNSMVPYEHRIWKDIRSSSLNK